MKVLVTNDDGIDAPGLHALARALVADGRDVVVVAPARDMSGSGAAIGQVHLDQSIDARRVELPGPRGRSRLRARRRPRPVRARRPPRRLRRPARRGDVRHQPRLQHRAGRAALRARSGAALTAANFGVRGLAVSIDVVSTRVQEQGARVGWPTARRRRWTSSTPATAPERRGRRPAAGANGRSARPRVPCHWDTAGTAAARALDWLHGRARRHGPQRQRARPGPRRPGGGPGRHAGAVRHRPHVGRRVGRDPRPPAARDAPHPGRPAARVRHRPRGRRLRGRVGHHRRPPRRSGRRAAGARHRCSPGPGAPHETRRPGGAPW